MKIGKKTIKTPDTVFYTSDDGFTEETIYTTVMKNNIIVIKAGGNITNYTIKIGDKEPLINNNSTAARNEIFNKSISDLGYEVNDNFEIIVTESGVPILILNITVKDEDGLNVRENDIDFNLTVYPNPFIDYINISGKVDNWKLFDFNGRLIEKDSPNYENVKINFSHLNKGKYILIINDRKKFTIVK